MRLLELSTIRAGGFLLLAQIMTGVNIVGSKYLLASLPILFLLSIRFSVGAVSLIPIFYLSNHKDPILQQLKSLSSKEWKLISAQALCAGIIFNLLMLWGLRKTEASVAGIITSSLPAIILVLSCLLLHEKLTLKKLACIALATLGLLVISSARLEGLPNGNSIIGDLIILLALLPEAMYYILNKLYQNDKVSATLVAAIINLINAVLMLPIMLIFMRASISHLSNIQLLVLLLVGLSSALFYLFWGLGSAKIEGVTASLATALMPVCTVIIAALTLGEMINLTQFIGMLLVISSIVAYGYRINGT
ncbi:MAG: putative Lipoprotein [Gammaproteobacteria bacterium]|jgi:drug/metabolite transporter (DMT)-like permease|nr:putative Lipoprotein [Gammaproteobacteria bacterium]